MKTASIVQTDRAVPYFLGGVRLDEVQAQKPEHETETVSLRDPAPQQHGPIRTLYHRTLSLAQFFLETAAISLAHALVYAGIFALVGLIAILALRYAPALLETNTIGSALLHWLSQVGGYVGLGESDSKNLIWFLAMFVLILVANLSIDFFYVMHQGVFPVPTWLNVRPWVITDKLLPVRPQQLHFGFLKVRYAYNDNCLFAVADGNHAVFIVELEVVERAAVLDRAAPRWRGHGNTPPVLVVIGRGRSKNKAELLIHGTYFEEEKSDDGAGRARAFAAGLNEKLAKRAAQPAPVPTRTSPPAVK